MIWEQKLFYVIHTELQLLDMNFQSQLKATKMTSPDIRAGISLLIAALSANGTVIINNIEQIDRGYENIEARLKSIGAKIERSY